MKSLMTHIESESAKKMLKLYVEGYITDINLRLRAGKTSNIQIYDIPQKEIIEKLDSAFDFFGESTKLDVYRTVDVEYLKQYFGLDPHTTNPEQFINTSIINRGYVSTSYEFKSPYNVWTKSDVIFHIKSKRKIKCININKILKGIDCEYQKECLLPRDLKFNIVSYKLLTPKDDKKIRDNVYMFEMMVE